MALGRPSCDTMRPVNQNPLSVTETNCSPSGATRMAEKPPKSANMDVNSRPPRYSSWPKRRSSGASGLNAVMDLAVTVMGTGESRPPRWAAAGHANAAAAPATTRPNLRGRVKTAPRRRRSRIPRPSCTPSSRLLFGTILDHECSRCRCGRRTGSGSGVSSNSSANFSIMAPPSSSASTMVTARR